MKDCHVLDWLAALSPQHDLPPLPHTRKRKRTRGLQTPPPDSSSFIDAMNTPAKRTATHVDEDQDETPRAPLLHLAGGSLPSTSSRTSQSSSRASPSKRRREAESMEKLSLSTRSFSTRKPNDLPEALKILLRDLTQASKGRRIISWSRREEIPLTEDSIEDWHLLPYDSQEAESPAFKDVCKIQRRAGKYAEASYDEAAWTAGVVFPLLELAIPDDEQLLLVPCTSARVVDRDLLPPAYASGKMVDICLAIDPFWTPKINEHTSNSISTSPSPATISNPSSICTATKTFNVEPNIDNGRRIADALRRVQRLQPFTTINHTNYQPLSGSPIALSIEVKRPSGDSEEAQRQLAVWQYAHWNMLQLLASTKIDGRPSTLEGLSFLPGIYIVGHKWGFSATVRDQGGEVVQWIDCPLGSTESAHGIYAIVWGLRRIAQYLTQVYWPWFQSNILRLANVTGL
uniref:PD-(D/E)XK nuclease-like domain-containing protein n=1 Tax=Pyricularia oryzae (strain P131) TaxID=1143193 RepID=L7IZQ4_PYRO1